MTACKFPGMTRAEYDANMRAITDLCRPQFRKIPGLLPDGTPDVAALMAAAAKVRRSLPAVFIDEMYRRPERQKTGLRECARRRRQMHGGLDDVTFGRGGY